MTGVQTCALPILKVFVSADTKLRTERPRLYVKFEENGDVLTQVMAFSKTYGLDIHKINRVSSLTAYVGGNASPSIIDVTKTALSLPEGKLAYFWGTLNQTHDLTGKLILAALGIFAAFVIFSLFEIGAPAGRHISDFMPLCVAPSATPCAWFPAEHAITPRSFSSGVSCEIL